MNRWLTLSVMTGLVLAGGAVRAKAQASAESAGATALPAPKSRLEIRDGWYHVDGRRFFVNALGYEIGARPGQHPYEHRAGPS